MMNSAAFQDEFGAVKSPKLFQPVTAPELLKTIWPDEQSRPSLRWLRSQQRVIPTVKVGKRVLFFPAHVLAFAGNRLTVLPQHWARAGFRPAGLPDPDVLLDATRFVQFLHLEFGLRRSLRWLRQQQEDRTLPFIRWGRRVFFSPSQFRAAWQAQIQK
jgi:hypothetical protein